MIAVKELKSYIERIERLNAEKDDIAVMIREIFTEAAANGFDKKAMRELIRLRKKEASEREELESLLELYKGALGMNGGAE